MLKKILQKGYEEIIDNFLFMAFIQNSIYLLRSLEVKKKSFAITNSPIQIINFLLTNMSKLCSNKMLPIMQFWFFHRKCWNFGNYFGISVSNYLFISVLLKKDLKNNFILKGLKIFVFVTSMVWNRWFRKYKTIWM